MVIETTPKKRVVYLADPSVGLPVYPSADPLVDLEDLEDLVDSDEDPPVDLTGDPFTGLGLSVVCIC